MGYQSITIEDFRAITNLEIKDMKRINLLVGKNNSGKTSILEALFLISGMSNPQLPVTIHNLRALILNSDEDFKFMFRNLNFSMPINVKAIINNDERSLKISPIYNIKQTNEQENGILINQKDTLLPSTSTKRLVEGISIHFQAGQRGQQFDIPFSLKDSRISVIDDYKETLECTFFTANPPSFQHIKAGLDKLIAKKQLDTVISVLKEIEPNITGISLGTDLIYVDIGKENLFPINIMGNGMIRILSFIAAIANLKANGILLVDEIENGLHYTSLSVMWKALLIASKKYNVQIVATTHSYESVKAFSKIYRELEPEGDDIRLYRIDKTNGVIKAFTSTAEVLKSGIENEFEIR